MTTTPSVRPAPGRRRVATLGAVAGAAALAMSLPSAASAATGSWNCSASALRATLTNNAAIEPLIANHDHPSCETDSAGVSHLGPSVGNLADADAVNALTLIDPSLAPAQQTTTAYATVANLKVTGAATPLIELPGTISSQVTATCVAGTPQLSATSTTVPLKIGGQTIPTDKPLTETLTGVGSLTGAVLSIKPGEEIRTPSSLTRRGLHVTLKLGSTQILDLVAAESTVSLSGTPCSNLAVTPSSGTVGAGGTGGSGSGATGGSRHAARAGSSAATVALLLAQLRAGFDQFGARVESTKLLHHGTRTRVRIGCWRGHHGNCNVRVVVFRKMHPVTVGSKRVSIRPGHIKLVTIRTPRFGHFPVYVHLMK
jgi:hypothetical protein